MWYHAAGRAEARDASAQAGDWLAALEALQAVDAVNYVQFVGLLHVGHWPVQQHMPRQQLVLLEIPNLTRRRNKGNMLAWASLSIYCSFALFEKKQRSIPAQSSQSRHAHHNHRALLIYCRIWFLFCRIFNSVSGGHHFEFVVTRSFKATKATGLPGSSQPPEPPTRTKCDTTAWPACDWRTSESTCQGEGHQR